jgi:hypothetical protein
MSDLAPFVAATIRDKVVDDLMKEVDSLKLQLSKTQEIEVTGPNGTPVYATGMLDQGVYTEDGEFWEVDLVERIGVPLSAIVHSRDQGSRIELHVGGSLCQILSKSWLDATILYLLRSCLRYLVIYDKDEDECVKSNLAFLKLSLGPFTSDDIDRDTFRGLMRFHSDSLSVLERLHPNMRFSFHSLGFDAEKIKPKLENFGIRYVGSRVMSADYRTFIGAEEHGEEFEDSDELEPDKKSSKKARIE